ncbi:MAG: hypothetical protein LC776_06875 [Acidobacteria bacterium]|nr:hypothetical protein [Acidobacteriota bacterium]
MKPIILAMLMAVSLSACSSAGSRAVATNSTANLTEDQKHRLYSAALASSESPLESEIFKDACRKIGIFDANGKPTDKYMSFVSDHVDWSMKSEVHEFRREIDTKEKASEYVSKHLER